MKDPRRVRGNAAGSRRSESRGGIGKMGGAAEQKVRLPCFRASPSFASAQAMRLRWGWNLTVVLCAAVLRNAVLMIGFAGRRLFRSLQSS